MAVRGGQYNVGPGSKAGSRGGRRNASTITAGNRTGGGQQRGRRGRRWREEDAATTGGSANRGTQSSLQPGGGHTRRDSNRRQSGRHNMQEMSESQVVGFLGRKIWQSMNDEDGDISDNRKENFNYYIGAEYGNEREGYSKFVTREVLETVEWVLPSVLRVFLSGDRVAVFEPQNPDDEQASEQETDITNYFVMRANNNGEGSFLPLHHWMKDALMYPNGYIKVYMEECTHTDIGTVTGISDVGVMMLEEDEDTEILEQRSRFIRVTDFPQTTTIPVTPPPMGVNPGASPTQSPPIEESPQGAAPATGRLGGRPDVNTPPLGEPPQSADVIPFPPQPTQEVEVFDLKIRTTKQVMRLRIVPVPPEECLVDNDTVTLNLDEADFVCHRVRKTYTQLVNEGYDPDELDQVGLGEDYQWNDERVNRLFYEDEDPDAEDEDDPSMRTFWVHECFAWYDYDGDGIGEHRKTVLIGDRVFENVEINYQPMIALSSILMQHKHTGMGYVDIMKDLQILQSILTRQLLDNIYRINNRRKFFSEEALTEDGATMEAMLNIQAEFIPVRGNPNAAVVPEQTQSIVGELLPVIQHFTEQRATRTGVTPESQVDPNSLQEIRQDVFTNAMDRASQRIEMLVRIFAETGYRQLMLKVHQLLRSHWDIERTIKLRGKWVNVDPQGWRDRTDMYVNVGLGFSTKQQQLTMLSQLMEMQKEALPTGMTNLKKMYNTAEKMVNAGDLGDARQYFTSPDDPDYVPPEPPPEDAQQILMKAQAQGIQVEQQRKNQEFQVRAQQDVQENQMEFAIKRMELQTKQREMDLKEREMALKEREMIAAGQLQEGELAKLMAEIRNTDADTESKKATADKTMTEAAATAMELTGTYQQAVEMVSHAGEENEPGNEEVDFDGLMMVESEVDEDGDETE